MQTFTIELPDGIKVIMDAASVGGILGTLLGAIPHFAALASLVWFCIRIYQEPTVQTYLQNRNKKKE